MENKVALVTGGMGGIGTSICQYFVDQGAQVIATYNRGGNHEQAQQWQERQHEQGYDIDIIYVDVTDFDSCTQMTTSLAERYPAIDILINNAGITRDTPFYKMDRQQWLDVVDTNLNSVFNVTRCVINGMIERNYGRIINISSINGQKGQFGQTNYSATKAGIHGFTKSLAQEVARKGITVNTISPGYVETDMVMAVPEKIREQIMTQIPIGRFGKPSEIARAAAFLAANDSGLITGSNLVINGGHYLL
jgi:acetoacetyl-CoA reductase